MTTTRKRKERLSIGFMGLWRTWAITLGVFALLVVLSPFISKKWFPLPVFILQGILLALSRNQSKLNIPRCYRISACGAMICFISLVVMIVINVVNSTWDFMILKDQPHNVHIPYITALILSTVSAVVAGWYLLFDRKVPTCKLCVSIHGEHFESGFLGKIYSTESRYQLQLICLLSTAIAGVDWWYYYKYYINVNLNSPDFFFFSIMPAAVYILAIVYLGIRYYNMWSYYCNNEVLESEAGAFVTRLRYLIFSGDTVYISNPDNDLLIDQLLEKSGMDTPARTVIKYTDRYSLEDAEEKFEKIAGVKPDKIRFAYMNRDYATMSNIFHYLTFFDSPETIDNSKIGGGEWLTLGKIHEYGREGRISEIFNSEMRRIYTIAITWKTYTPTGKRLYEIKNYKPTFRIRDIRNWDVDYNDFKWLAVANVNQDKPFYRLRRLWQRYIKDGVQDVK
ncbi:MAG: hypothetical protein K2M04_06245 [Muribaculaceae bacterium]|nr:hypothetical protein [Muribaculaceae bacterium]